MFHFIWVLIIGAIIGAIAGAITKTTYGWIGNIVAGIVGSWLGESLLGSWGPSVAGMAIFPSLIGAVILVFIASLVFRGMAKR
ncbi:GlsB/YeaQ/YmgE family stress response membrane protein [Brochothrix thermosphacta]|uniref:GlsB/YeaQ/YmgE family stress response membrane protein n=1 Tax=Brochothrix thermosphacta TaxID=2756 RepID=UPI0039AFB087